MRRGIMVVLLMAALATPALALEGSGRGGPMGFISGCCFGLRTGLAYNEGKDLHWREWCRLIPYVGFVFNIWDGIDCANGATTENFAAQYGKQYF